MPPDQMAYLQGFSRAFGDKTPAEIKAIMDKSGPDGKRVADVFQLASNPNIKTGLPETQPQSIDHPSSGGKYALPDGIQRCSTDPSSLRWSTANQCTSLTRLDRPAAAHRSIPADCGPQ